MTYVVNVAYPSTPGARFDNNYYLKTHMPLVAKKWAEHGLQRWNVTEFNIHESPYVIQAVLYFKDKKSFEAASADGEEVFGDIPNFTDLKPTLYHGFEIGAQQKL
ncbi:hypothetical protein CBS101457_002903 [Exobasidium rhododendri]|nr:hypothetical protein CBS101457_002903 [Exobasidium rhododendri]